jgi:hypothetical protein
MAVNLTQNSDGTTTFVSNTNSKTSLVLSSDRGGYFNTEQYVSFVDDFLGDALDARWSPAVGTDAQAVTAAINVQAGGVVRQTSGDTVTVAESLATLTHELNWKANSGGLYLKCRFKPVTSVADVCYNIGFSDVKSSTLEIPITISGTTITTNATDAVVFVYDTAQTNDTWHCQGVANDVDTAIKNTTIAPAADTWTVLEIAISSTGTATFWIDGTQVHSVASAVTATVALTPIFTVMARTTTVKAMDLDYVVITSQRPA